MDDEDLFRITEVDEQEEEAIRFIFALKSELKDISQRNLQAMLRDQDQTNVLAYISEVEDIYTNICNQIRRLQDSPKLLQIVQNEIKGCIIEINTQMQTYRFDVDRKRGLAQDNTKQNNIKQNGNKQNSAF